jgi:hypothetical protein
MKTGKINALVLTALVITALGLTAACNRGAGSTPTATFKAFYEATKNKDAEAMKKTLSKGTLEMLEGFAKAQNKTLDESLKSGLSNPTESSPDKMPETRNEKIDGEKATLEVKNEKSNTWETLPFVKEDGAWKIALDEMFRDAFKKLGESLNTNSSTGNNSSVGNSNTGSSSAGNGNTNKP